MDLSVWSTPIANTGTFVVSRSAFHVLTRALRTRADQEPFQLTRATPARASVLLELSEIPIKDVFGEFSDVF